MPVGQWRRMSTLKANEAVLLGVWVQAPKMEQFMAWRKATRWIFQVVIGEWIGVGDKILDQKGEPYPWAKDEFSNWCPIPKAPTRSKYDLEKDDPIDPSKKKKPKVKDEVPIDDLLEDDSVGSEE